MNSSFENKVALVTGAASGMGLATAKAFAEAGAAVALADVNEAGVRSAAEDLVAAGHKANGIRCDVAGNLSNATPAVSRPDGSGRPAVRCIRASTSRSRSWLNALVPAATSAVPTRVCSSRGSCTAPRAPR